MRKILSFLIAFLVVGSFFIHSAGATNEECKPTSGAVASLDLEISAVYPNPNSGESEWVELSNLGKEPIDLSLYTLEDGTAKPWTLTGILDETIQITGFPFQLNNSDEIVTLKTLDGEVVDQFEYASSKKGETLTKASGSATATTSESETASIVTTSEEPVNTPSLWPVFSEALPNPEGSDSTNEWIELYNPHGETLSLKGLYLDDADGGSSPYALSGTLAAESYLLIYITESKLTLNNDSDHIRLLGANMEVLWDLSYSGSTEGESYADFGGGQGWTEEPSPGEENRFTEENSETDEDSPSKSPFQDGDLSDEVKITEVYPNPEGPDAEEEWIEITNGGTEAVKLGNWTVDDGDGGSDPYTFPDDTVIQAGETLILYRTKSGIALNNSNETVILTDYTGETMSEIFYESSEEGQSYAEIEIEEVQSLQASSLPLGNQHFSIWEWVSPSPGEPNPVWKQIKGEVEEWDGDLLTLFDGISTWTFKTTGGSSEKLLYQVGNQILVQASALDGFYTIMHSELLENKVAGATHGKFPWSLLLTGSMALSWVGYELYKKRKSLQSPSELLP